MLLHAALHYQGPWASLITTAAVNSTNLLLKFKHVVSLLTLFPLFQEQYVPAVKLLTNYRTKASSSPSQNNLPLHSCHIMSNCLVRSGLLMSKYHGPLWLCCCLNMLNVYKYRAFFISKPVNSQDGWQFKLFFLFGSDLFWKLKASKWNPVMTNFWKVNDLKSKKEESSKGDYCFVAKAKNIYNRKK